MKKNFADIFRELRKKKNLTQEELAEDFNKKYFYNYKKSAISMYENGKRVPEINALKDFADYFNVSLDYLLGKSYNPELTVEEEIDVAKKFEELKDSLENTDELMFHGEILDEETRELLLTSLQQTILTSKIISKEREKNKNNKWGGENEQRKTKS